MILLPLEGVPRVCLDALNEAEEWRVVDWISTHPGLLELVERAYELAEESRAA